MTSMPRTDTDVYHNTSQPLSSDLSHANTMALSCTANEVVTVTDEAQLDKFMSTADDTVFVLSGGSNVLLPARLNITVLRPLMRGITVLDQTLEHIDIEVMAGENWHDLVVYTVAQGWYGLENLALIPGLTGAAPVQNIGAYGVQLEDTLHSLKAYHIPTKTWHQLSPSDCQFGYRDSIFKHAPNTWLITRVTFRLHLDENRVLASYGDVKSIAQEHAKQQGRLGLTPSDVMHAIIDIRSQKLPDPKQLPNCGSYFQNPIISQAQFLALQTTYPDIKGYPLPEARVKVAAGWLIEQAGLKGSGVAPIMTHIHQALVLTNHAPFTATQSDVALAQAHIISSVYDKFAITLNREPVWVNMDGSIGQDSYV
ncbi:UDP-N-acetylmuramate dehydrogenase [Psychrobacter sp. DM4]|uniref:UDP-N-acetylmuramate dehydrogenase n=1 Tax=Psychrobacter sp. DM4 TaxID=3440637 RepID=UPI003F4FD01A